MFEKVLVATDLSPASDVLVDCLGFFKTVGTQEIVLAHVIYIALHYPDTGGQEEAVAQALAPKMESQRRRLEAAGFLVTTIMPVGLPYVEIDRLATENGVDLIAMGSHGKSLLAEALLGSVSDELVQHTRHPVFVVRMKILETNGERRGEVVCREPFARLLYPTDFSETSERAFLYVERIVSSGCRAVDLLHVRDHADHAIHQGGAEAQPDVAHMDRLSQMEKRLRELGATEVSISAPHGSPASVILGQARSGNYSLIVMGSQGRGFLEEIFLGSVAHSVVRQAPIPVLLIPAKRQV